ncbi:hypothetical protein CDD83_3907 [Cordyceps sp. RAO-2017]|nr:hypothetical protein CDD83_3907 [Cordyceps sp. RAO-2017]
MHLSSILSPVLLALASFTSQCHAIPLSYEHLLELIEADIAVERITLATAKSTNEGNIILNGPIVNAEITSVAAAITSAVVVLQGAVYTDVAQEDAIVAKIQEALDVRNQLATVLVEKRQIFSKAGFRQATVDSLGAVALAILLSGPSFFDALPDVHPQLVDVYHEATLNLEDAILEYSKMS